MPIPKSTETKQPILQHLEKAGRPVKVSAIAEFVGQHFNLSKEEIEERTPKGLKRFSMCIATSTKEMKAAGLVSSPRHGFLEITRRGRGGLAGSTTQAGTATNGRRKPGKRPVAQTKVPTNGRRKLGRPSKAQTGTLTDARVGSGSLPMPQVKASTNGRRKPGRPKTQPATQFSAPRNPSVTPVKRDDKLVQMATDIVVSYVGKNAVSANQIPELIKSTYASLARL